MFGTHDLALFITSGLLLNITPGADSLYIVTRSLRQGWRAGMVASLGIASGCVVHICAAALGLSALLATSAAAFTLVKLVGGLYLVYIGISLLRSSAPALTTDVSSSGPIALDEDSSGSLAVARTNDVIPVSRIYVQGFLTNVLNPKVALFFLAFVPQFIQPDAPSKAGAFLFLGAVFNFNGTLWCLLLAWSAARFRRHFARQNPLTVWLNRMVGGLFVGLGLKLALSQKD